MEHHISQEETRRIIINDMVKKRHSIVPIIGEDTYFVGVSLVFIWLSYRLLKWISSAFEEGLEVMWRYTLLTNIGFSANEACLVATRTYVREAEVIKGRPNKRGKMEPCPSCPKRDCQRAKGTL